MQVRLTVSVYSLCAKPVVVKVGVGPPVGGVGQRGGGGGGGARPRAPPRGGGRGPNSKRGPPCSEAVDDQGKNVE